MSKAYTQLELAIVRQFANGVGERGDGRTMRFLATIDSQAREIAALRNALAEPDGSDACVKWRTAADRIRREREGGT